MSKATSRVMVRRPDHPRANSQGMVPRTWLVMEDIIGRPVSKGEVIHHEDEDPRNDNPSNLRLFSSQREHAAYHQQRKAAALGREGYCATFRERFKKLTGEQRAACGRRGTQQLQRYAAQHPEAMRGMGNPAHRLRDHEIREIRSLRGRVTRAAMAAQFGVSHSTIDRVLAGKSWIHIGGPDGTHAEVISA